jgi:ketosteroid isomerase-like protein
MKKILLIINVLLCQNAFSQNNISEKLAISQVIYNQQVAWNNGSIESFMTHYWHSDSLKFIGKKGITYGWQNTLDNYKKSYPDTTAMGQLAFEINSIDVFSKSSAFVIGKWFLKREKSKGDLGGYFSLIFKKIKNKWVIVVDHTS